MTVVLGDVVSKSVKREGRFTWPQRGLACGRLEVGIVCRGMMMLARKRLFKKQQQLARAHLPRAEGQLQPCRVLPGSWP